MVFLIDGFDIVPFIGENGIKWTLQGIDSPTAGRSMDTFMQRGLLGYKARGDISCLWMPKEAACALLQKLMPEFVQVVTDTIPWISGETTLEMYSNNIPATCLTEYTDGTKLYGDVTFPLVER